MGKIGFLLEHPGVILREEYLQPLGISQTRFARDVNISFRRTNELLNGKRGFSPDTALRVAKYLGTSPEFWMNWQGAFDLQQAEKKHASDYRKIKAVKAA